MNPRNRLPAVLPKTKGALIVSDCAASAPLRRLRRADLYQEERGLSRIEALSAYARSSRIARIRPLFLDLEA